jgi:hypothetical protein
MAKVTFRLISSSIGILNYINSPQAIKSSIRNWKMIMELCSEGYCLI